MLKLRCAEFASYESRQALRSAAGQALKNNADPPPQEVKRRGAALSATIPRCCTKCKQGAALIAGTALNSGGSASVEGATDTRGGHRKRVEDTNAIESSGNKRRKQPQKLCISTVKGSVGVDSRWEANESRIVILRTRLTAELFAPGFWRRGCRRRDPDGSLSIDPEDL